MRAWFRLFYLQLPLALETELQGMRARFKSFHLQLPLALETRLEGMRARFKFSYFQLPLAFETELEEKRAWFRFFYLQLPLALGTIAVVVEIAAYLLSGVTLHRHNVDDLANAVTHDNHPYRVVLLSDSVTHNVAHRFRIGDAGEVADLTTHFHAGLPSSLFLLTRYVESGHHPKHVVLAASPGTFVEPQAKDTFKYYVTSVFTLPKERDFLSRYYPTYLNYGWRPAALSITTKIGEPLFSLIRRPGDQIWTAPDAPSLHPVPESFPDLPYDEAVFKYRVNDPPEIRPEVRAVLREMCVLSRRFGFSLHVIWAPVQPKIRDALVASGKMQKLTDQLLKIAKETGASISIDDSNGQQEYPSFDYDTIHIKGVGWEQVYATQLGAYIHHFESQGQ